MPADAVLGFNQRHVMALRQKPGCGKPRYSRANDGYSVRIQAIQAFPKEFTVTLRMPKETWIRFRHIYSGAGGRDMI
jgi:hypothetical protein